jgi:dTDP-4-dehydrorhamnose 3,5-epimerase
VKFVEASLNGAFLIEVRRAEDARGFFARTFSAAEFSARGLPAQMPECSVSFNARKGTLRGLHFQAEPHAEDKLVRCTAGAIYDVIVDLRADSPSYRRWFAAELTASNHRSLFVPKGFAHGFMTLEDNSEVFYMISAPQAPGFERGIRWNDPLLGIEWPMQPTVLSARDTGLPLLDGATHAP